MSARDTDAPATDAPNTDAPNTEVRAASVLEQLGGVTGLVASSLPVLVFVVVNAATTLTTAIWASVGAGLAVAAWRLVRREGMQPAVSGLLGVAVAAYIAHRTGSAKGFFLLGIWTSVLYGGVFVVSVVVRWPLVGVAWSVLNGHGWAWRQSREAVRSYDIASLAWAALFFARFAVQYWLYNNDQTGWLAAARIAMGWPLTGAVLLLTIWVVRRGDRAAAAAEQSAAEPFVGGLPAATGLAGTDERAG